MFKFIFVIYTGVWNYLHATVLLMNGWSERGDNGSGGSGEKFCTPQETCAALAPSYENIHHRRTRGEHIFEGKEGERNLDESHTFLHSWPLLFHIPPDKLLKIRWVCWILLVDVKKNETYFYRHITSIGGWIILFNWNCWMDVKVGEWEGMRKCAASVSWDGEWYKHLMSELRRDRLSHAVALLLPNNMNVYAKSSTVVMGCEVTWHKKSEAESEEM